MATFTTQFRVIGQSKCWSGKKNAICTLNMYEQQVKPGTTEAAELIRAMKIDIARQEGITNKDNISITGPIKMVSFGK